MQITILDRERKLTYDEIPHGSIFLWRLGDGYDYDVFVKPMADVQIGTTNIHAIGFSEGRTVRFENPGDKKFIPVTLEDITVRLK